MRPGGPAVLLEPGCPEASRASLAVASWPDPGAAEADAAISPGGPCADPGLLFACCHRALRPGGMLAVVTASQARRGRLADLPGETVARARAAGLVYAQHIIALRAVIRDSKLAPRSPAGWPDPQPAAGAAPAHVRVHCDLLVFTKPGGARDD